MSVHHPDGPGHAVRSPDPDRRRRHDPDLPGPQPENIGIDPRYKHHLRRNEPVSYGQLRAKVAGLHQEVAEGFRRLAGRDATSEALINAMQEKLEEMMHGVAELGGEAESLILSSNTLNDRTTQLEARVKQLEALAAKLAARLEELEAVPAPLTRRTGERGACR